MCRDLKGDIQSKKASVVEGSVIPSDLGFTDLKVKIPSPEEQDGVTASKFAPNPNPFVQLQNGRSVHTFK
ncbi:hypothetical protein ANCCAN_24816 [Ancylostoma caninum]|uniref:Uncharacterized protein n=1 Tax=Ancylostoma caninum TaxID=29170 RepID=A0A368FCU0_ANCCA|nr:hypothetical protein ANCCAN_24816 [Ancylostoma caninum]